MTLLRNSSAETQSTRVQALFVGAVVFIILASWLLAHLHAVIFDKQLLDPVVLLNHYRSLVAPKPIERFVFLTLAFLAPLGVFGIGLVLFRQTAAPSGCAQPWLNALLLTAAGMLYLPLTGFEVSFGATTPSFEAYDYLVFVLPAISLALACFWYLGIAANVPRHPQVSAKGQQDFLPKISGGSYQSIVWLIFFGLLTLQIVSWRLLGERSVTQSGAWFNSADAVFYSVSQVAAGSALLVDLPSQYGYFPFFCNLFSKFSVCPLWVSHLFAH